MLTLLKKYNAKFYFRIFKAQTGLHKFTKLATAFASNSAEQSSSISEYLNNQFDLINREYTIQIPFPNAIHGPQYP